MAENGNYGRTESDINLSALAIEAERRRKQRGLIRYNYGDLVAEITPEERLRIIDAYRKRLRWRQRAADAERFVEPSDKLDMQAIREKRGIPAEKEVYHPPKNKFAKIRKK